MIHPKGIRRRGQCHGSAGMSGIGFLNSVHCETSDGIDAEGFKVVIHWLLFWELLFIQAGYIKFRSNPALVLILLHPFGVEGNYFRN
jgi:hypothetical protein